MGGDKFKDKDTIDEYGKELDKLWRGKNPKKRLILLRLKKHKKRFIRISKFLFIIFFIFVIYKVITRPIRYTDEKTIINREKLEKTLETTGDLKILFDRALDVLKEQPYYYKKVVNNIDKIIISNRCPYMCVTQYLKLNSIWDLIISPKNQGQIPLIINPAGLKAYNTDYKFASALIHESDHIEYLRSGRLRKFGLMIKCNPVTNFRISVDSTIPSIVHRVSPMEICAQKEQIKFHKKTKTKSGYEIKNGILYNFSLFIWGAFKFFFSLIAAIFKSIF